MMIVLRLRELKVLKLLDAILAVLIGIGQKTILNGCDLIRYGFDSLLLNTDVVT